MAFEMLVGVNVIDDDGYTAYRNAMSPLLASYGGGFRYDFKIAEVLRSQTDAPINRVFVIYFTDEESSKAFLANEEYNEIKHKHFDPSVSHLTTIATYEN